MMHTRVDKKEAMTNPNKRVVQQAQKNDNMKRGAYELMRVEGEKAI